MEYYVENEYINDDKTYAILQSTTNEYNPQSLESSNLGDVLPSLEET